jgi:hypothetical protein
MKVSNITSTSGNSIANQFIVTDNDVHGNKITYFQSYESIIVKIIHDDWGGRAEIYLDSNYWDYSKTTGKYRNIFLGETKAETQKKINSGVYILTDLN